MRLSVIHKNVKIGKNSVIGNFVEIGIPPLGKKEGELETIIGANSMIRSHTVIYAGNRIGDDFQTGHQTVIRENNIIGNDVRIGTFSEIAYHVHIDDDVKFHSDCHIYEETIIKKGARFNPGVYILNTKYPYRPDGNSVVAPAIIRENARIGANVIIMPCVEIGKWALIGAGSLVIKSVPDYAVAIGRPARIIKKITDILDEEGHQVYVIPKD